MTSERRLQDLLLIKSMLHRVMSKSVTKLYSVMTCSACYPGTNARVENTVEILADDVLWISRQKSRQNGGAVTAVSQRQTKCRQPIWRAKI